MNDSEKVRTLVIEAVATAADFIDNENVAARWDDPSALEGMTVGALAAHLVRAAGATLAYLDRTSPDTTTDGNLLNPVTYFHAAVDSPIHKQIKDVSSEEAANGHAAIVTVCRNTAKELASRLRVEPESRLVGALGGRLLTLDDFCRTRLIEVLLHMDDLAASIGEQRPEMDPEAVAIVIDIIIGIARQNYGDWAVLHSLARVERSTAEIFPVF